MVVVLFILREKGSSSQLKKKCLKNNTNTAYTAYSYCKRSFNDLSKIYYINARITIYCEINAFIIIYLFQGLTKTS